MDMSAAVAAEAAASVAAITATPTPTTIQQSMSNAVTIKTINVSIAYVNCEEQEKLSVRASMY